MSRGGLRWGEKKLRIKKVEARYKPGDLVELLYHVPGVQLFVGDFGMVEEVSSGGRVKVKGGWFDQDVLK